MSEFYKCPTCTVVECFAYEEGHCLVLTKNDFGNKECPFFKTKKQVEQERAYCKKRLADMRKGEL